MAKFIQQSFKKIETMRNQSIHIGCTKNYGIITSLISKYLQISREKITFLSTSLTDENSEANNGNLHLFQQCCWKKWDCTLICRLLTFLMHVLPDIIIKAQIHSSEWVCCCWWLCYTQFQPVEENARSQMGSLGFLACASQEYLAWPALVFESCFKPAVITNITRDTLVRLTG